MIIPVCHPFSIIPVPSPQTHTDACITRVSNLLGAQQPLQARTAALTNLLLTFSTQTTWSLVLLSLRNVVPKLWTHDEELLQHVAAAAIPAAIMIVPDGCCAAFNGVCVCVFLWL